MKIPDFKKWRVSRWLALLNLLILAPINLLNHDYSGLLYLLAIVILWLLIDNIEGTFKKRLKEEYRCYNEMRDIAREILKHAHSLKSENAQLKEQLARLKSIYHIKDTEEENIKPII